MKRTLHLFFIATIMVVSVSSASATTWFDKEFVCPIDQQKNTFKVVGSYGSYIYSYPSKYQWLFFPRTDSPTFYICSKCHFAAYMWDFDKLPKEKIADVKKVLATIQAPKEFKNYLEVPVTERLAIIEKINTVMDRDDEWWELQHRVMGYHFDAAGKAELATAERKKSLELLTSIIKAGKSEMPLKLLLYISGAMRHFTGDDKGAVEDLKKALATKYAEKGAKAEDLKNGEEGLNERIDDYILQINGKEKPRLSEQ